MSDQPGALSDSLSLEKLNARLKQIVEEQTRKKTIRVCGMAWDVRRSWGAHVSFELRQEDHSLSCMVFRRLAETLPFKIENGQQLLIEGRIDVYERQAQLQLVARAVELVQESEYRETLSSLTQRVRDSGYLDPSRKRPLPPQPEVIGLITGKKSVAYADVTGSLKDAGIKARTVDENAHMEGPNTAREICSALEKLNKRTGVQAVIIARGGGSKKALGVLNNWELVEAIVHSRVPVVTAIGHRDDETVIDLVADVHVPTPSTVGPMWADLGRSAHIEADESLAEEQTRDRGQAASDAGTAGEGHDQVSDRGWGIVLVVGIVLILIVLARFLGWI